jgi:LmbE family N-acetylglucosaminyl deacetylase
MVMSGSGERVLFVYARPGDEVLSSGGTIARLRHDGAGVAVVLGSDDASARDGSSVRAAMDELNVTDWRILDPADHAESAIQATIDELRATTIVVGSEGDLADAALRAARRAAIPVYLARRAPASEAGRMTAIDVVDHVEQKMRALAAYTGRWSVEDGAVALPDGSLLAVTGSETYTRLDPPPSRHQSPAPAPLSRAGSSLAALVAGMAFGVLGTIGHQSTVAIGPVQLPVGLVLALAGAAGLLVGLRMVTGDRLVVLACAIGMLGTIFLLSLRSTGGSVLIPAGIPGTLWSIVPALVATLALGWPKLPAQR